MEPLTIALRQFTVATDPSRNLATIRQAAKRASEDHVRVLVLPEGIIARNPEVTGYAAHHAQTITGPFVSELRKISLASSVVIMGTVHIQESGLAPGKVSNVFLVIDSGRIRLQYRKLHLYDAFDNRESDVIQPGSAVPPLIDIDGWRFGVMTCYDLRFPELARAYALAGADVLVAAAAWVRGPLKEEHWAVSCASRAIENTCYLLACGELSTVNIGCSRVLDPLGEIVTNAGTRNTMVETTLDPSFLHHARKVLPVLQNMRFSAPRLK